MEPTTVSKRQARVVQGKVAPMLGYLTLLRRRMGLRGFTQDDRLYALVQNAELALRQLAADLEERSIEELKVVGPSEEQPFKVDVTNLRTREMRKRMKQAQQLRS
jgi:hypothetical protein